MRSFAHDAPEWGPYAKQYPGASAIVDRTLGVRWDCSVFPAVYRGPVTVPCHRWDSGFNPVWAAPDLSAHAYGFELPLWRDGLAAEVAYARVGGRATAFRATLRNADAKPRTLSLHVCAGLALPWIKDGRAAPGPARLRLREGDVWIAGTRYREMEKPVASLRDGLPYDATIPGECAADGATDGFCFRWDPKEHCGATLRYEPPVFAGRRVFVRLRLREGRGALNGLEIGSGADWRWLELPENPESSAPALRWIGETVLEVDGLLATTREEPPAAEACGWAFEPAEVVKVSESARLLRYSGSDRWFGIAWHGAEAKWREFRGAALEEMMPPVVHHHVATSFQGRGEGHFANAFLHYVPVPAGASAEISGVFATGRREEVEAMLRDARSWREEAGAKMDAERATAVGPDIGRTRLAATLLTNIVYPVRRAGEWFAHRSPGKWWDSLYTWDSGFIGLGLLEIDPRLAAEVLDHYLCDPADNPHAAFVHHGSLVPTQAFLALEIWNRTRDLAWLRRVLPALRRYYLFYAGHTPPARIADMKSGLLRPWDYFYNSGGWDDYAAQSAMHRGKLAATTTPAVTTAMAVVFARILSALETCAGREPSAECAGDIGRFSRALQEHAWDEAEGVFGYVLHDEDGRPSGLFRHDGGRNFNLGLDGVTPLSAGVATAGQRERLLALVFDPRRLWTPLGVTAVDQSAPYYEPHGYWNGTVWLPYQWVLWKTMLDLGEAERADRIATAALKLWEGSVAETGRCYEHFVAETGQGAGWHHFGGLSAPAICFHDALRTPGRLTCGLRMTLGEIREERGGVRGADIRRDGADTPAVVLLGAGADEAAPQARLGDTPLDCARLAGGGFAITIPAGRSEGVLRVSAQGCRAWSPSASGLR